MTFRSDVRSNTKIKPYLNCELYILLICEAHCYTEMSFLLLCINLFTFSTSTETSDIKPASIIFLQHDSIALVTLFNKKQSGQMTTFYLHTDGVSELGCGFTVGVVGVLVF